MSVARDIFKKLPKKASEPKQPISGSFLAIYQATDMLEQKSQQFWNLLIQAVLMIPINPPFLMNFFSAWKGGAEHLKKICGTL